MDEAQSRRIAGLLGPTIIVMIVSEFPLVQPRLTTRKFRRLSTFRAC
jgi:uncharacterized protein YybS (DUF2232 family)